MSVINELNTLPMSGLYIIYGQAGAIYDGPGKYGTSHLMEHLICHTFDDLRDTFQANSINHNAYTSNELVVVHFTGLTSRLEPLAKEIVAKLCGGVDVVTEEMFENEKRIVLQEYGDAFANPIRSAMYNGLRKVYGAYGPIGERSCIENFTYDDFKQTYEEKYRKPSLIIYVGPTGMNFAQVEFNTTPASPISMPVYSESRDIVLEKKPDIDRSLISCFSKSVCTREDSKAFEVACDMLGSGLNSPLYQELREKSGLSYYSYSYVMRFGTDVVPFFSAGTDKKTTGKVIDIYDEVFGNLDKYLTKERYDLVMNEAKVARELHQVLRYENFDDIVTRELGYALNDDDLDTITFERVLEVAKRYISLPQICKYTM